MWPFGRKRGRELFRVYELKVIDAIRATLPPEAAEQYDRQVEAVRLVQRHFDDTDVATYPSRSGPQYHDPAHAFANRSLELELATLTLRARSARAT